MSSAAVSTASSGATSIVSAPGAGKRIRVLGYCLAAAGAVTAKWQSAANDLTGAMSLATGVAQPSGSYPGGCLDCNANEALNINLGGAVQVSGWVNYVVIGA